MMMYDLYFQGAEHCDSCRNFQDGPYCVSSCPDLKYHDEYGVCRPCHPNCRGCTGSSDELGPGGCLACSHLLLDNGSTSRSCLNETITECPLEFYFFRGNVRVTDSETLVSVGRTNRYSVVCCFYTNCSYAFSCCTFSRQHINLYFATKSYS